MQVCGWQVSRNVVPWSLSTGTGGGREMRTVAQGHVYGFGRGAVDIFNIFFEGKK